jgi:hypothetical protein
LERWLDKAQVEAVASQMTDALANVCRQSHEVMVADVLAMPFVQRLKALAPRLDGPQAQPLAAKLAGVAPGRERESVHLAVALTALASRLDKAEVHAFAGRVIDLLKPQPDPMPYQDDRIAEVDLKALARELDQGQVVELLKHPGSIGPVRRALLRDLGRRAGREFPNLWGLVDWLRENDPDVDLAAPPQKPQKPAP